MEALKKASWKKFLKESKKTNSDGIPENILKRIPGGIFEENPGRIPDEIDDYSLYETIMDSMEYPLREPRGRSYGN